MLNSLTIGGFIALVFAASEPAAAGDAEVGYHKAYYLEVEEGNFDAAIPLYEEVVKSTGAPAELVAKAKRRLASCREQARASDLARLMPQDVLAYVELRHPGEHIGRLLEMAGLTQGTGAEGGRAEDSASPPALIRVSPRLIEGLKGLAGAAVAITEFDARHGIPSGVAVLNAGRDDLLHGLIETLLSGATGANALRPGASVNGHPSYVSPFATIVVTDRLVFAGNPRELVEDAVRRLEEESPASLASTPAFAEAASKRASALAFAFVNAKRGVEILKQQTSRNGEPDEQYQIAQAFADVESLRWAALSLGTSGSGVSADFWLQLDEGNHALAYHLLRTPPVRREALRTVPAGAAALFAMGFAEDKAAGAAVNGQRAAAARYVTGLDFGRELFANMNEAILFLLPPSSRSSNKDGDEVNGDSTERHRGPPIPDAGLVLTVKDSAKSHALWKTILGIPSAIGKGGASVATKEDVDGHEVEVFTMPGHVQVYLAELPDRVILATRKSVLARAFQAAATDSVLDDPGFAKAIGRLADGSSKLALVHGGRAWQVVGPLSGMRPQEADQVAAILEDATVSIVTEETPTSLHASVALGVPRIGALLRQMVTQAQGEPRKHHAPREKKS